MYIFTKSSSNQLENNYTYETLTGTTCFNPTIENTSCTGGTITDIYVPDAEEEYQDSSYIITFKELRSCNGFENVSRVEAEVIIQSLYQLSNICYQSIIHE
jgi:hypothetical protein